MQVSISKAAEMVGITRATLYRHIEKKNISVEKDEEGNPKIDVSELVRVYGDKVTPIEQLNSDKSDTGEQDKTPSKTSAQGTLATEVEVLKERIKAIEQEKDKGEEERSREREQLNEQIIMLRERLEHADEQQKRLTLLLTDQRKEKESGAGEQDKKLAVMEATVEELRKQNRRIMYELQAQKSLSLWERIFGAKQKIPTSHTSPQKKSG